VQGYPYPGGYPPPPPQRSSGPNVLVIVLIVLVVLMIFGGGACLFCVGLAASVDDGKAEVDGGGATGLVHDELTKGLEGQLQKQGIPADSVACPRVRGKAFTCELVVGADTAKLEVKDTGAGYSFDVPNTAFLDGQKLAASFAQQIDPKLVVPCFKGSLMKAVGASFTCDVTNAAGAKTGTVTVAVNDAKGSVHLEYEGTRTVPIAKPAAKPQAGPRVVDFVCPAGKKPGGAVRAGCLCGDEILGTACGAPGNFTDVVETPRGCRFTCN
jgi:hypothetical protein